jgi:hypothetical protein
MGPFYNSRNNWYSDYSFFLNSSEPWFIRGGFWINGSNDGLFNFNHHNGVSDNDGSARLVLSPKI